MGLRRCALAAFRAPTVLVLAVLIGLARPAIAQEESNGSPEPTAAEAPGIAAIEASQIGTEADAVATILDRLRNRTESTAKITEIEEALDAKKQELAGLEPSCRTSS